MRFSPLRGGLKKFFGLFCAFWYLGFLSQNIVFERSTRIKVKTRLTQLGNHYKNLYNYSYINTTIAEYVKKSNPNREHSKFTVSIDFLTKQRAYNHFQVNTWRNWIQIPMTSNASRGGWGRQIEREPEPDFFCRLNKPPPA